MVSTNPYQSPTQPTQAPPLPMQMKPPGEQFAPCPNCRCTTATRVKYTMWGGVLGPKLLTHVKCAQCGSKYNGKTGKSNMGAIIIYTVVLFAIAVAVFGGLQMMK
jgi:hypothetical protein